MKYPSSPDNKSEENNINTEISNNSTVWKDPEPQRSHFIIPLKKHGVKLI